MERGFQSEAVGAARSLRTVHSLIGTAELACLASLWFCAITRRRNRLLALAITVLVGEAAALLIAHGCPLGVLQRKVGDEVPMFERWFGRRLAPFALPTFSAMALTGVVACVSRPPLPSSP